MFSVEFLLKLISSRKVSNYIFTILFISIITLVDFLTLFIFGQMIGIYLYLGIIGSISFFGVIIVIKLINKKIIKLENKHALGKFPKEEFNSIISIYFSSFLIIFPGIVSSVLGYIFLIPQIRNLIGKLLTRSLNLDWNAVYEYKEIYKS